MKSQLPIIAFLLALLPFTLTAQNTSYTVPLAELTDFNYPDNPDIGFRASDYQFDYFSVLQLSPNAKRTATFDFLTQRGDTLSLREIDLTEFIPTAPSYLNEDAYLRQIAIINQEWNRNQVRFTEGEFTSTDPKIVRIDLARNCLNAYLWEVIVYTSEKGKTVPYAHGWFDFPHDWYQELFTEYNGIPFAQLAGHLVDWKDPESKKVNRKTLRKEIGTVSATVTDMSNEMYPVAGARRKKYKEILTPKPFRTMDDLQTDAATFATFTPPGFYTTSDPRTTQLGRFANLKKGTLRKTRAPNSETEYHELELIFNDQTGRTTHLLIGGLDLASLPTLPLENANDGWKSSMGFGNHPFYETWTAHQNHNAQESAYYAYLTDHKNNWLDSHTVGIDGPILHWDAQNPKVLHVWLLSFERHALIGRYEVVVE